MAKSKGTPGAATCFIDAKFQQQPELDEECVARLFAEYSDLGFADMLIAAQRNGGFTRDIIVTHMPSALRDGQDVGYETMECFWQALVFLTRRYKWAPLSGMRTTVRTLGRKSKKEARKTSIKAKVIAALGGEGEALQTYEALRSKLGTVQKVVDHLVNKEGVTGLKLGTFGNIISLLKKANRRNTE